MFKNINGSYKTGFSCPPVGVTLFYSAKNRIGYFSVSEEYFKYLKVLVFGLDSL